MHKLKRKSTQILRRIAKKHDDIIPIILILILCFGIVFSFDFILSLSIQQSFFYQEALLVMEILNTDNSLIIIITRNVIYSFFLIMQIAIIFPSIYGYFLEGQGYEGSGFIGMQLSLLILVFFAVMRGIARLILG
jgi:hypothetical protein